MLLLSLFLSSPATAGVMDFIRQYNFGIDYASTNDGINMSYETGYAGGSYGEGCEATGNPAKKRCSHHMAAGGSSGFGFFLQRPFQRQGDFYLAVDLGVNVRWLTGALSPEGVRDSESRGLPLREAEFQLLGFVLKPYLQVGYTPSTQFPDILFSLGPTFQITAGQVSINEERKNVVMGTASGIQGFMELEVVFWRFGEGFLSVFSSRDFSGGEEEATSFYPKEKDGMDEFRAAFSRNVGGAAFGYGIKLLTTLP